MYEKILQDYSKNKFNLDSFMVNFCYNSGKIENGEFNYNDTREIFEKGTVSSYSGDVKTLIEQVNQKKCMELIIKESEVDNDITLDFIKQVHFILMNGAMSDKLLSKGERAGEFKKGDYVVGINDVGASPDEVEDELISLLEEVNSVKDVSVNKVLNVAAYFHAWFEFTHPFADGNGRTGRMLLNYYLMAKGHPPIIIYNEDKKSYYLALEEFSSTQDVKMLIEFFKQQCIKTWERKKLERISIFGSGLI